MVHILTTYLSKYAELLMVLVYNIKVLTGK